MDMETSLIEKIAELLNKESSDDEDGALDRQRDLSDIEDHVEVEEEYPTDSDVHSSSDDEQPIRPVKLHRSNILTSDSETEETSETLSQSVQSRIVVSSTRNLSGKNGHKWSSTPAESSRTRTQARNLVHVVQGPMGAAKDVTEPLDCFSIFITNE